MRNDKSLNEKLNDTKKSIRLYRGSENDKCFFTDCSNKSIGSHSISESRVLSLLEGLNEKNAIVIYHLENVPEPDFGDAKSLSTYHQTHRKLFPKGKSDISVFFGFCNSCDDSTFEVIDNCQYENKSEINFLHSLRTKAHYLITSRNIFEHMNDKIVSQFQEADEKGDELKNSVKVLDGFLKNFPDDKMILWEEVSMLDQVLLEQNTVPIKSFRENSKNSTQKLFKKILDKDNFPMKGQDFKKHLKPSLEIFEGTMNHYEQSSTDELKNVLEYQLEKINSKIKNLTSIFREDNFGAFEYLHISIEGAFSISGAFVYQYKVDREKECILTFFPERETGKTHFIFAVENGESKYLSFLNLKTDSEFRLYASSVVLSAGSNVFLSPQYWNVLSKETKDYILSDRTKLKETRCNLFDNSLLNSAAI